MCDCECEFACVSVSLCVCVCGVCVNLGTHAEFPRNPQLHFYINVCQTLVNTNVLMPISVNAPPIVITVLYGWFALIA